MKTVLFIACVCIVSAVADKDSMAVDIAKRFVITKEQALECINKTGATEEGLRAVDMHEPHLDTALLNEDNTRRVICAFTCATQTQGMMVGTKLQLEKIRNFVDHKLEVPELMKTDISKNIDTCYTSTEQLDDECAVGLKFFACLLKDV